MLGRGKRKRKQMGGRPGKSITGTALLITGDLDSDAPIRIHGKIDGDIRGTTVTVTRTASITGSVFGRTVRVAGTVDGLIKAVSVVLTRHARVTGDVICEKLEIEAGADIGGRCIAWQPDAMAASKP